jgi:predicted porin
VSDQSSRILFNVEEDLGEGLSAVGQFDLRFKLDQQVRVQSETTSNPAVDSISGGNNHVGLKSRTYGTLRLGRQDIYYTESPSLLPSGLFLAATMQPVIHSLATANASRTPNLMWYESPRFSGFQATVGYSTNPLRSSGTSEAENDVGGSVAQRKGRGAYLKLNYVYGGLDLTYARVDLKSDYMGNAGYAVTTGSGGTAQNAQNDQKGSTLVAKYDVGNGFKVGAGYTNEKQVALGTIAAVSNAFAYVPANYAAGTEIKATAKSLSGAYKQGSHNFVVNYAKRGNLSYAGTDVADSGIKLGTLAYSYDLSKRTAVGVMYTSMKSGSNTSAGLFYQGNNAYGGQVTNMLGETQKITSFALRHSF